MNPFNSRAGAHTHAMDTRPFTFLLLREKSGPGYEATLERRENNLYKTVERFDLNTKTILRWAKDETY